MYEQDVAPVREGDEIDVKIEAIGDKGDGIAKKDGFVLVIPGTQLNDQVRVKITKVLRKVGFAEVVGSGNAPKEDVHQESVEASDEPSNEEDVPKDGSEELNGEVSEKPVEKESPADPNDPTYSEDF
jgi:predicted RNA-binding protein with TRAM domain